MIGNGRLGDAGPAKVFFTQHIGDSWRDLCDALEIPSHERARFPHGYEPTAIWEWLEKRGLLGRLHSALISVDRDDVAERLPPGLGAVLPGADPSRAAAQGMTGSAVLTAPARRRHVVLIAVGVLCAAVVTAGIFLAVTWGTGGPGTPGGAPSPTVQCGLDFRLESKDDLTSTYVYTIRQCRAETIKRKIDVANFNDGACHTIKGGATVTDRIVVPLGASIRGIKPC